MVNEWFVILLGVLPILAQCGVLFCLCLSEEIKRRRQK